MFYFEFSETPVWNKVRFSCTSSIYCRLRLSLDGRKALYHRLASTPSYFLILGQPVRCVGKVPKTLPLFKKEVRFTLPSLREDVGITLRGITSQPTTISGLPKSAEQILELQNLDAQFGYCDHRTIKPLPKLPRKRKFSATGFDVKS